MSEARTGWPSRRGTPLQVELMSRELGYDDDRRFALLATSGFEIGDDPVEPFGVVFSIIDCDTGVEFERSPIYSARQVQSARRRLIGRVRHLNAKEDPYA